MTNEAKQLLIDKPELCKEIAEDYCKFWCSKMDGSDGFDQWIAQHTGKPVFEGDVYYWVSTNDYLIWEANAKDYSEPEKWTTKQFSTRESAEQWVEDNKPRYSIADLKARGLHI